MPPSKVHSRKTKKRRFTGNQYTKKSSSSTKAVSVSKESTEKSDESSGDEEHAARGVKSESETKRRKKIRKWKKGFTDTLEANEGPSYEAGAF